MDIAGLSVALNQQHIQTRASFAVMNQSIQIAEQTGEQLIQMFDQSMPVHPTLGNSIDRSV